MSAPTPGLRGCSFVDTQISSPDINLISTGMTMPNFSGAVGADRFWFHLFLLWQPLGAGGIRYRFNNISPTTACLRKQWDVDGPALTFFVFLNNATFQFIPTANSAQVIEIEGTARFTGVSSLPTVQFAQGVADPAATVVLVGSYLEWTVI